MRIIEQAAAMLAQIVAFRKADNIPAAQEKIEGARQRVDDARHRMSDRLRKGGN